MPMRTTQRLPNRLFTVFHATVAALLLLSALGLVWEGAARLLNGMRGDEPLGYVVMDALGFFIISMAVLDLSKFLVEEEVFRDRELRAASEARRTLTKFMVIICIAMSLESLVNVLRVHQSGDITELVYPAALLAASTFAMVGLGIYQRLSREVESEDRRHPKDPIEARDGETTR